MGATLYATRERHKRLFAKAGQSPYPTWSGSRLHARLVHEREAALRGRARLVTVAGRLSGIRRHGGVAFLDVRDASATIQIMARRDAIGSDSFTLLAGLDLGDFISVSGRVIRTRAGEVTIEALRWSLLSKALAPVPDARVGLKDEEERARRRELDFLANPPKRAILTIRDQVLTALRKCLRRAGFREVETPVLQIMAGGAAARPFRTRHRALGLDLSLRVAPELFLKRLIVSGEERIYEIGRCFRNEGLDRQHNPEFTMCELYQAFAAVQDLIPLFEKILGAVLRSACGSLRIRYQGTVLDFTPPWKRVSYVEAVRKAAGVDVLTERRSQVYRNALRRRGAALPEDQSLPSLIDALFTDAVRRQTTGPLLVFDAPAELVPLAKRRPEDPRLVQRVQLVVAGMEILNAYTEENDPQEQELRFREQAALRGHADIHPFDTEYLEALRLGLPPTAGAGLGLDRIVMLAADRPSIRDVLAFPLLRPRRRTVRR